MDLQYAAGVRSEGVGVVPQVRPVGGADLAQRRAGGLDQVRQPEAGTDLDQFTAAHDHVPAGGEGRGGQHQRGSPVVDHQRVLGSGTGGEQCSPGAGAAAGAAAGCQVELHVDVAAGCDECFNRAGRKRGAAEVGMDDYACCVEHRSQGCRRACSDGGQQDRFHLVGSELTAPRLLLGVAGRVRGRRLRSAVSGPPPTAGSASRSSVRGIRRRGSTCVHSRSSFRGPGCRWLAEADGNRTRQAEILEPHRF